MQSVLEVFWDIILAILGAVAFAGLAAGAVFLGIGCLIFGTGCAVFGWHKRRKNRK